MKSSFNRISLRRHVHLELEVDLESGGTAIDEDRTSDPISANEQAKTLLKEAWTGPVGFQGSVNLSNSGEVGAEDVELLIDKNSEEKEGRQKASVDRKGCRGETYAEEFEKTSQATETS
ncbi:hypothetical protein OIU77_024549 [Salix suchowensis]|uniref:Uncharacterized protein n=1 Tax=Salix suchowensis TaxID=1278906 RepID=A0ABQ9BT44_9ROSI|nr:hypothetical protein OIU77_024549 [Salix suchowensis]